MVGKGKPVQVEGQFTNIRYQPPAGLTTKPSTLQVLRNVENAVKKVGGTVVATDSSKETLKLTKDGKELWIEVWADYTGKYILTIVEKAAMTQQLVANADAFANGLKTTGHIAVEGIYFDTAKAELKPESAAGDRRGGEAAEGRREPEALRRRPHRQRGRAGRQHEAFAGPRPVGGPGAGQTHGIAAARLKAFGTGPYAPVASNDTEEGRAKNRRVELVKQ